MQDAVKLVGAELRSAWRYRWYALAIAWIVCLLGWLAVYLTPDVYEARAKFYLDAESALQPFVKDLAVGMDVDKQVDLVKQVVLGRDALLMVAQESDLAKEAANPIELEALLERLRTSIQLSGGGPSRLFWGQRDRNFEIAYRDGDRERAVKVVQLVLDNFIENTLDKRSTGFQSAQVFLQQQIRQQEERLADAESKLADFKRRNIDILPAQDGSFVGTMQSEMAGLQELRAQQRMLEGRRGQLSAQLTSEKQFVPSSAVPAATGGGRQAGGSETDAAILQAQKRLDELLRSYTPKHPEVIALQENLTQLRAERRKELAEMGVTEMPERDGLVANPVYEQIRLQRNQVDVELAAVRGRIADRTARVSQLRSQMETAPEVEAELKKLTRDYDVLRDRYGELLQQLESAKLSERVGQTDQVDFSILDPPAALASPVAPPRLPLLLGVLVAGLGAGAAAAWAMSKLNPVFDSLSALRSATGLPVLGAVSVTWLDRRRARRRTEALRVAVAGAVLVALFVGVVVARDAGSRLLTGITG